MKGNNKLWSRRGLLKGVVALFLVFAIGVSVTLSVHVKKTQKVLQPRDQEAPSEVAAAVVQTRKSNEEIKMLQLELETMKEKLVALEKGQASLSSSSTSTTNNNNNDSSWNPQINPLSIPQGQAKALPSILADESTQVERGGYGGKGDKQHLGGFARFDAGGLNPGLMKRMITDYGVRSVLDIGCGRGLSTSWFSYHGLRVLCAEGSHDAVTKTLLPNPSKQLVEHDFSRGPWWPKDTFDVAWSVEVLEHINLQFMPNYISAFRKAALVFVTSSSGEGWHHVEVHEQEWWVRKYESFGLKYSPELTEQARNWARETKKDYTGPNGEYLDGFYLRVTLKVFINPVVAALPQHIHLFPDQGCVSIVKDESGQKNKVKRPCLEENNETPLDPKLEPLKITDEMDDAWSAHIKENYLAAYQG